jgi:hypothetical protein
VRIPGAMAFVAVLGVAPWALADEPLRPVIVYSVGPKEMRVRVAAGVVGPCSSSSNTPLFDGQIASNQQVILETAENCVCVEHTYDDFPDSNWSEPLIACHVMICAGRTCRPNPDPTIRVTLSSAVPPTRE